jgi:hypothetical protein
LSLDVLVQFFTGEQVVGDQDLASAAAARRAAMALSRSARR